MKIFLNFKKKITFETQSKGVLLYKRLRLYPKNLGR